MGADISNDRGGGALEVGDLRLVEDSSERGAAQGSDVIVAEAARGGMGVGSEGAVASQQALTQNLLLGARGGRT